MTYGQEIVFLFRERQMRKDENMNLYTSKKRSTNTTKKCLTKVSDAFRYYGLEMTRSKSYKKKMK